MSRERLVVIGGDAAGMSAASQARKRRDEDDLEIVAFERGRATSYSACGIPYWIGGAVGSEAELIARTPEQHRANGIDLRMRTEVVGIDLSARRVTRRELETGREYDEPYDSLVYATAACRCGRRRRASTHRASTACRCSTTAGPDRRAGQRAGRAGGRGRRRLHRPRAGRGLPGARPGRDGGRPLGHPDRHLRPDIGAFIADAVVELGIRLVLGQSAARVETGADGRAVAVHLTDGQRLPADLVVLGLGVRPNVGLAQAAGIPLGPSGGIAVDNRMRTQVDGVWSAGDCVESRHRLSGQRMVVALGTHANKQGRVVGINLGGGYATFPGVIGTAVTKVCDLEVARTGLSEAEAEAAGYRYVTAHVDSTTKAGYFPGAKPVRVKLLAEKRSGRLLGGQIVGREGAAKRIDVLATAIWNEMSVDEVLGLDLSYAPPFSPVWDPVLIAARKAFEAVEADIRQDVRAGHG
jgi:NADPH-dependent 2,4-dienoyl-CoA reductase/sulfur reductase-like enzyme